MGTPDYLAGMVAALVKFLIDVAREQRPHTRSQLLFIEYLSVCLLIDFCQVRT